MGLIRDRWCCASGWCMLVLTCLRGTYNTYIVISRYLTLWAYTQNRQKTELVGSMTIQKRGSPNTSPEKQTFLVRVIHAACCRSANNLPLQTHCRWMNTSTVQQECATLSFEHHVQNYRQTPLRCCCGLLVAKTRRLFVPLHWGWGVHRSERFLLRRTISGPTVAVPEFKWKHLQPVFPRTVNLICNNTLYLLNCRW